jgi:L,D-transpeptidase catalytic domain
VGKRTAAGPSLRTAPRANGRGVRRLLPAVGVPVAVAGIALAIASGTGPAPDASDAGTDGVRAAGIPDPVEPAFVPGPPRPLGSQRDVSWYSPVRHATRAHAAPAPGSRIVARLSTRTPEGTRNIVLVLGRRKGADGRLWMRVRLPVLPNNTTGWLPRRALGGYAAVRTRLVIDLDRLTATLHRGGHPIFRAPVGVGRTGSPTPRGEFYIRNRLTKYATPFYGPLAFGTSARSSVLTDWPAGGFVGIHGTNRPDLLPGHVSHGCIRMRNADILELARVMPVGTPLTIR